MNRLTAALAGGLLSLLLFGCGSKDTWDLVTVPNGMVYRINKRTGEVALISGTQIFKADEAIIPKTNGTKKSHLRDWPVQTVKVLGNISLLVKTTYREGSLQYILSAGPITAQLKKTIEVSLAEARFVVRFVDASGFLLLSVNVPLSEMSRIHDDSGEPQSFNAAGSSACSVDTYEAIAAANIGWVGFQ